MPDNPPTPKPPEPAATIKKMTTRVISIQPAAEDHPRPGAGPSATPSKTIVLKRPVISPLGQIKIPSQPAGGGQKETARIEEPPTVARETKPASATGSLAEAQPRPSKSDTIRISLTDILPSTKRPTEVKRATAPFTEQSTVVSAENAKKGTTRLILDATATGAMPVDSKRTTSPITVIPQTIRLKRPGTPFAAPRQPQPKARTDRTSEAPTVMRTPDRAKVKSSTSRIFMDETIPPSKPVDAAKRPTAPIATIPAQMGAGPTPRTIRLKRPSSSGLEEDSTAAPSAESPIVQAKKAETAKIDLPIDAEPVPLTQRKTIKIKRTERNVAPRTVMLKHAGTAAASESAVAQDVGEALQAEADEPSTLFFGLAAAAVVLIACLVYVMAAQAFGPELILPVPASLL